MKAATISEVIDAFLRRKEYCKASSVSYTWDDALLSYKTTIAQYDGEDLLVNVTKYSSTTSRHQNELVRQIGEVPYIKVNDVPIGTRSLKSYRPKQDEHI